MDLFVFRLQVIHVLLYVMRSMFVILLNIQIVFSRKQMRWMRLTCKNVMICILI